MKCIVFYLYKCITKCFANVTKTYVSCIFFNTCKILDSAGWTSITFDRQLCILKPPKGSDLLWQVVVCNLLAEKDKDQNDFKLDCDLPRAGFHWKTNFACPSYLSSTIDLAFVVDFFDMIREGVEFWNHHVVLESLADQEDIWVHATGMSEEIRNIHHACLLELFNSIFLMKAGNKTHQNASETRKTYFENISLLTFTSAPSTPVSFFWMSWNLCLHSFSRGSVFRSPVDLIACKMFQNCFRFVFRWQNCSVLVFVFCKSFSLFLVVRGAVTSAYFCLRTYIPEFIDGYFVFLIRQQVK